MENTHKNTGYHRAGAGVSTQILYFSNVFHIGNDTPSPQKCFGTGEGRSGVGNSEAEDAGTGEGRSGVGNSEAEDAGTGE